VSLVSEALKKAQREAAQREGRARQLPEPLLGAAAQPFVARRRGRRLRGLAALAVLAATAGGLAVWRLRPAPPAAPVAVPTEAVAAPVAASEAPARVPALPPTALAPSAPAVAEETVAAVATGPRPAAPAPAGRPAAAAAPGEDSGSRAPAKPEPVPAADGTYLRRAVLADGTAIELGGIAWSPETPVAMLNGRLLGLREGVAGCLVEAIERDQVRLRCADDATLTIRLMERRRRPAPARGAE